MTIFHKEKIRSAVYGLAVGDALGVPFEFKKRGSYTCKGMTGYGTWNQKPGTFSDDTSLTLAMLDSVFSTGHVDCMDQMQKFADWYSNGQYTCTGEVFDCGLTIADAIEQFMEDGTSPFMGIDSFDMNGNGALMRIVPLAFTDCSDKEIADSVKITHGHRLNAEICTEYVHIARNPLEGKPVKFRYREPVASSGYILDTFNAAMYCLASTLSFEDCLLCAVNLGNDTDTTGAVTGALAGIMYGYDSIPKQWLEVLRGKDKIENILQKGSVL